MARPKFTPKSTPYRRKPPHLPHPWTCPTYDAKWHPDLIRHFSTMHWTDRPTDTPTDVHKKFDDYRPKNYTYTSRTKPNETIPQFTHLSHHRARKWIQPIPQLPRPTWNCGTCIVLLGVNFGRAIVHGDLL